MVITHDTKLGQPQLVLNPLPIVRITGTVRSRRVEKAAFLALLGTATRRVDAGSLKSLDPALGPAALVAVGEPATSRAALAAC